MAEDIEKEGHFTAAGVVASAAVGIGAGVGAAYIAGESTLKNLNSDKLAERLIAIGEEGIGIGKTGGQEYLKVKPPPLDAKALEKYKQEAFAFVEKSAPYSALKQEAKHAVGLFTAAEQYRTASFIQKPWVAFKAAPVAIKATVIGVGAIAALGTTYLIRRAHNEPVSHVERLENERDTPSVPTR